jgi:hypothetical protein
MKDKSKDEIDLLPDAWERFERAVKIVAKAPPQHKIKKSESKSRVRSAPKRRLQD